MTIRKKALGFTAIAVVAARGAGRLQLNRRQEGGRVRCSRCRRHRCSRRRRSGCRHTPQLTIAMVTHEAPGDSFWDKVRAGAGHRRQGQHRPEVLERPDGAWRGNLGAECRRQQGGQDHVTLLSPDTMKDSMAAAKSAGIPTVARCGRLLTRTVSS